MTLTVATPELLTRVRDLIAAGGTSRSVEAETGVSRATLLVWARKHGLGDWQQKQGRGSTIPPEFADFYLANTASATAERFGVCRRVSDKWASHLGIRRFRAPANAKLTSGTVKRWQATHKRTMSDVRRDLTSEGRAADYLQRFGAVFRCNERGGADAKGSHWRRGSAVLTGAELIERAEQLGFAPDAWRQIAA